MDKKKKIIIGASAAALALGAAGALLLGGDGDSSKGNKTGSAGAGAGVATGASGAGSGDGGALKSTLDKDGRVQFDPRIYDNLDPRIAEIMQAADQNNGYVEPIVTKFEPETIKDLCTIWNTKNMPSAQQWSGAPTLQDYQHAQIIIIRKDGREPWKVIDKNGKYVIRNIPHSKDFAFSPLRGTITLTRITPDKEIYMNQAVLGEVQSITSWMSDLLDHSPAAYSRAFTLMIDKASGKRTARTFDPSGLGALLTNV